MKTVSISEAKKQFSRLVDEAVQGKPFVITKAGKPRVQVTVLCAPSGSRIKRLGFMCGQISVPDDFDRMGESEMERTFLSGKWSEGPQEDLV